MARGNGYGDRRDHRPANAVITSAAPKDGVLNSFDRGSPACRAGPLAGGFRKLAFVLGHHLAAHRRRRIHD
jgi:hypothetical protein